MYGNNPTGGGGSGGADVVGPASSSNNAVALFSGTTGKLLKNSNLTYTQGGSTTGQLQSAATSNFAIGSNGSTIIDCDTDASGSGAVVLTANDQVTILAQFNRDQTAIFGGTTALGSTKYTFQAAGATTGQTLGGRTSGGNQSWYIRDNGQFFSTNHTTASTSSFNAVDIADSNILCGFGLLGSTYVTSGVLVASRGFTYCTTSYAIAVANASGIIAFGIGSTPNEVARFSASGGLSIGTTTDAGAGNILATKHMYSATVFDSAGAGSPEGAVTAGVGSTFRRTDGGAGTSFYVKESGAGNTGWVAK